MTSVKKYGLIGYPLAHSWSPNWFRKKFQEENIKAAEYQLFPIKNPENIRSFIQSDPALSGLNVTIPYKTAIIPYLDDLDPLARETGAVNVIRIIRTTKNILLKGYNTDVAGFKNSLVPLLHGEATKALIMGTGGASKAVMAALKQLNIPFHQVSRSVKKEPVILYQQLTSDIISGTGIIINATPVGQEGFPGNPFPEALIPFLTKNHLLFDLVYNPPLTPFLKTGQQMGCHIQNGYDMLCRQAELSWKIWNSDRQDET